MSCHTALVITVQRCLCYLLHALCFSPVISPDFARRGCPELGMKEQVQQQQTCKQRLYNPFYTGLFKKRDLSICPLVYSAVSRCPPVLWSLSAAAALLCWWTGSWHSLLAWPLPERAAQRFQQHTQPGSCGSALPLARVAAEAVQTEAEAANSSSNPISVSFHACLRCHLGKFVYFHAFAFHKLARK